MESGGFGEGFVVVFLLVLKLQGVMWSQSLFFLARAYFN